MKYLCEECFKDIFLLLLWFGCCCIMKKAKKNTLFDVIFSE